MRSHVLIASILATAVIAAPALAQPAAGVVDVRLSEYKFAPAELDLQAGRTYVLHLTNTGAKGHDLSAKAFFQTVSFSAGSAAKVKNGQVDVDEGESVDVAVTPQQPGTYEMHCTRFMHAMFGMKGRIVVR